MVFKKGEKCKNWNGFKKGHHPYTFWKGKTRPDHSKFMKENNPAKTLEARKKLSEFATNHNNSKRPEVRMKISKIMKQQYIDNPELRKKIKQYAYDNYRPNIGKHEKIYLDWIQEVIGYPIIRQYFINGYFLDGYCKERNLAIEIDERPKNKFKDIRRENEIKQELNCMFLRISDFK